MRIFALCYIARPAKACKPSERSLRKAAEFVGSHPDILLGFFMGRFIGF
jgi:hypothetical protein